MNISQKKTLSAAVSLVEQAASTLSELKDELQEDFDDRSETWQESDAGAKVQETIDRLESGINELEETAGNLSAVEE